jgi:2OG-Fe(II) oxygenase superfamily
MATTKTRVGRLVISGRELFICDNFIDPAMVTAIGSDLKTMPFVRKEKSRVGVPGLASSANIDAALLPKDPFFLRLRAIAEEMFPGEVLHDQRAYVNSAVYGDSYYIHRDSPEGSHNVTVLYYANLIWEPDWGGETIFYKDDNDAVLAVSPRPGRLVISRGAILHRGTVPTQDCNEARLTIAYKLNSGAPPSSGT